MRQTSKHWKTLVDEIINNQRTLSHSLLKICLEGKQYWNKIRKLEEAKAQKQNAGNIETLAKNVMVQKSELEKAWSMLAFNLLHQEGEYKMFTTEKRAACAINLLRCVAELNHKIRSPTTPCMSPYNLHGQYLNATDYDLHPTLENIFLDLSDLKNLDEDYDFSDENIYYFKFNDWNIQNCHIVNSNLSRASWTDANIENLKLENCVYSITDLAKAEWITQSSGRTRIMLVGTCRDIDNPNLSLNQQEEMLSNEYNEQQCDTQPSESKRENEVESKDEQPNQKRPKW